MERRGYHREVPPSPDSLDDYDELIAYWLVQDYEFEIDVVGIGELWQDGVGHPIGRVLPEMDPAELTRILRRSLTELDRRLVDVPEPNDSGNQETSR